MKPIALAVVLCAALGGVGAYTLVGESEKPVVTGGVRPAAAATDAGSGVDAALRAAMNVVKVEWRREGFGYTAAADVSVRNNNTFAVRVDRISCRFRTKDGATEDHAQGVYDVIQPRAERTIRNVSLGFVGSDSKGIDCSVAGARKDF